MSKKVVLITGATSGIGHATAHLLAAGGYQVIATGTNPAALEALNESDITAIKMDVTNNESIQSVCHQVQSQFQRLDCLVNCAGVLKGGPLVDMPESTFTDAIEVNLNGLMRVIRAFFPLIHTSQGRFIHISSEVVNLPGGFTAPYCVSKTAAESLCDCIRREFAFVGVDMVMIQPGAVKTAMLDTAVERLATDNVNSLFSKQLDVSQQLTMEEEDKAVEAKVVAEVVMTAIQAKKPKLRYIVNQDPIRRLIGKLPASWVDWILKKVVQAKMA